MLQTGKFPTLSVLFVFFIVMSFKMSFERRVVGKLFSTAFARESNLLMDCPAVCPQVALSLKLSLAQLTLCNLPTSFGIPSSVHCPVLVPEMGFKRPFFPVGLQTIRTLISDRTVLQVSQKVMPPRERCIAFIALDLPTLVYFLVGS